MYLMCELATSFALMCVVFQCSGRILERYIRTGRSSTLDATHLLLALSRLRFLIPIQVSGVRVAFAISYKHPYARSCSCVCAICLDVRLQSAPRQAVASSCSPT